MNIEAKGFAELDRLLQRLPDEVAREHLTDAVEAGANFIKVEAARRAPRDEGDLAASITVHMTKQRNTGGDPRAEIGPSKKEQHVGRFQEFGTAHHAAHPFLRPALDSRAQDALNVTADVLRERLAKLGPR
jgi:HK97 gp10 family phage protein